MSVCLWTAGASPQASGPDDALVAKARGLYDAPFTRDLVSFDCAVQFDWKQHFVDLLGSVPSPAVPTVERLQLIRHRVFVDRSGATVSATPIAPDLSGVAHGSDLGGAFNAMVTGGLNAWMPFATNVILPVGPTKSHFEKIDSGYRLTLNGPSVSATLSLTPDLRLINGVSQMPQSMKFTTDFSQGPNGFLLNSVRTGDTNDAVATFTYTYRPTQGFQLPTSVTIKTAAPEVWHYALSDCKVQTGVQIKVGLPKK